METPVRILFASSEVAPFAMHSDMAQTIRQLPEHLQEAGTFESRIMMPRYGLISERRNRLHEVIRLSGSKINMGNETETLKVKVASIPGIRLQVYFMDSARYFKRKGIYESVKLGLFEDNAQRALFFARSVLRTAHNLGWSPDIIHAHGWLSALIPLIIRSDYDDDSLFSNTKCVYSPDGFANDTRLNEEDLSTIHLPGDTRAATLSLDELGPAFADATVYSTNLTAPNPDAIELLGSTKEIAKQASAIYTKVVSAGNVLA